MVAVDSDCFSRSGPPPNRGDLAFPALPSIGPSVQSGFGSGKGLLPSKMLKVFGRQSPAALKRSSGFSH